MLCVQPASDRSSPCNASKTLIQRRRRFRQALTLGLALSVVLVCLVFAIGPSFVAKRFNSISEAPLQPIDSASQALHDSLQVADLHADSLLWGRDLSQAADYGHVDVPRLLKGNVALQVFTVVTKVPIPLLMEGNSDRTDNITKLAILQRWPLPAWSSLIARALYQAKQLKKLEGLASGEFQIIRTQQDLQTYLSQREQNEPMTAGLLGLEGAQALEGKLRNVDRLYDAGFRMIGLAHFFDTDVSGSAHGLEQGGLTPFGKQVVERMANLNMVIDLAHASSQTIDDVLQLTTRPVIVSHTGVKGTCEGVRNLSDRQIQQIAATGGIIGIGFWQTAVCGEDVDAIVQAIRYTADQVGVEHVALGSDFDGAVRVPFDVANLAQITQALQKAGFTETEIRQIMGLNVLNLLEQLLPNL
ncbi:MAG: dipeptidase [Cyanobacteria bacterium J06626_18]